MSRDPIRWKEADDAPGNVRDLLREGSAVGAMPPDVRASILERLPSAASPPASPNAPLTKNIVGSPGAAAIAVVAIAAAVAVVVWTTRPSLRDVAEVVPSAAPSAMELESAAESADVADPAPEPEPSAKAAKAAAPPRPPASDVDTLAAESALIGRARANLVASPAAALSAIDEHARRFPRGELTPEREYLRISALRRLGRSDEARASAKKYLMAYPSSPYAPAVRTLVSELGEP